MKKISATAVFKIKDGKLDEFKQFIPQFIAASREKDPGTLVYECYLNEKKMECVILEAYTDSSAMLAHAGNIGELLEQAQEISDLSLEVYGNPDKELQKVLEEMGIVSYPYFARL